MTASTYGFCATGKSRKKDSFWICVVWALIIVRCIAVKASNDNLRTVKAKTIQSQHNGKTWFSYSFQNVPQDLIFNSNDLSPYSLRILNDTVLCVFICCNSGVFRCFRIPEFLSLPFNSHLNFIRIKFIKWFPFWYSLRADIEINGPHEHHTVQPIIH